AHRSLIWMAPGVLVIYQYFMSVRSESLMAMRGIGLQLKTTYRCGLTTSRFIDQRRVVDVIINEGFRRLQAIFYLAVLVDNSRDMVVLFGNMQPSLDQLRYIRSQARSLL
ncbi:hypothetical protein GQ42DRAFT_105982, partial [Ramicandelaber brevisporus]